MELILLHNFVIAAIPHTEPWNFNTALVMIICNLVAVVIGRLIVAKPFTSKDLSLGVSILARNFTSGELLASFCFGHILGVGFVLGLTNMGVI
jgi:photosystem I subunit X